MTRRISVSDVSLLPLDRPVVSRKEAIQTLLHQPIEAVSEGSDFPFFCDDTNPLLMAAHDAFFTHRPLVLNPDVLWFCLAQGFANHVNLNAEQLRDRFVRHSGKEKLVVCRPDFFLGQPNPWPEAFEAFSEQVAEHVGKLRDLVVADFSTTGPTERAATEVLLMDTFQAYFEYEMLAGCGISEVVLEGTADDWRSIRVRASVFAEYGLEEWTSVLLPILDRIVDAAEGEDDPAFWQSIFRYQSGSGGSLLTGWLQTLFPYLTNNEDELVWNTYMAQWQSSHADFDGMSERWDSDGPGLGSFPRGLSSAPVKFTDVVTGEETDLRFVAGLFGVCETEAGLAPEIGWAVVHGDEKGKCYSPYDDSETITP